MPLAALPAAAQLSPPSTGGAVGLAHELRFLGHDERVLMIGAHPDDEDTELLTLLTRGMGAESAYLALNRGEGGQNLIGPELGEALGLLRTEELLGARRLDGAHQYFTRAYDFGFSKTLEDTWQHWPRDSVLKDVVRIIRKFRPQVVVSIFSGTPRDGHGQHQAAGWAAHEAFLIAGDSSRFPELQREEGLAPWTPLKLYRSARFDTSATTLTLDGGALDPAVGQTFHQIAMRGRSNHRSQDMGQLQRIGPSPVRVSLWEDRSGGRGSGLFGGIDTTLAHWAAGAGHPAAALDRFAALVDSLRARRNDPTDARFRGLADSAAAALLAARDTADPVWVDQWHHLGEVRVMASGVLFDGVAGDSVVAPGGTLPGGAAAMGGGWAGRLRLPDTDHALAGARCRAVGARRRALHGSAPGRYGAHYSLLSSAAAVGLDVSVAPRRDGQLG